MVKKCLWCLKSVPEVSFYKKAHTIPLSLGGINYNNNVCDTCNEYFGDRKYHNKIYSIEEALKETFNITRQRLLMTNKQKRKTGRFKSRFFEIKQRDGNYRLEFKTEFKFSSQFQLEICRAFKRGLYKMFFEELNRQKGVGYEHNYDLIRKFARYNEGDLPVFYFIRTIGVMLLRTDEAATPFLLFERMKYLYSNEKFVEIEFLGHVFGFPISNYTNDELYNYRLSSFQEKKEFFKTAVEIERLTDIDITLNIMDQELPEAFKN